MIFIPGLNIEGQDSYDLRVSTRNSHGSSATHTCEEHHDRLPALSKIQSGSEDEHLESCVACIHAVVEELSERTALLGSPPAIMSGSIHVILLALFDQMRRTLVIRQPHRRSGIGIDRSPSYSIPKVGNPHPTLANTKAS